MDHALATVWAWDPFIKGIVFVLAAVAILVGSVYMVLATDVGARLGFLVAGAALFGWIFLMAVIWTAYGIGFKGRPPTWKPKQVVTGDIGRSPSSVLADFPEKWKKLDVASPQVAEAQAAADVVLTTNGPFKLTSDYKTFDAYAKGGEKHFLTLLHKPHYLVLEVQPLTTVPAGSTAKPQPDPSKPVVSVVMVRDLGSLRQPAFVIAVSTGMLFFVFCYALHLRDKSIMALRAAAAPAPTG
jgi:hypothetical protein